ncbi:hypothetical protein BKA62DRAFT_618855 [Auriculariales sp. MPI-PUGE-AT-0066]|nr:hypothetical protein BKA62DRAFT_618855 [Auriculariales sp. MPI-PUGE-AT-0066]
MLTVRSPTSSTTATAPALTPAAKFRTVLGLSIPHLQSTNASLPTSTQPKPKPPKRKQIDPSLYASVSVASSPTQPRYSIDNMPAQHAGTQRHRGPVAASQDGPWSVSAAEVPNDPHSYSIYIKTPTHNITLTRTAPEIVELNDKLRNEVHNANALPKLPIDAARVQPPQKRKSSFLHTLSRFTSSSSNSSRASSGKSSVPSNLQTPLASPGVEVADPLEAPLTATSVHSSTTGLAAYLTTLSNDPAVRVCRPWRKFVRVRTDDLESVRVERAIKRVRSDLAAHHAPGSPSADHPAPAATAATDQPAPPPKDKRNDVPATSRPQSITSALTQEHIEEADDESAANLGDVSASTASVQDSDQAADATTTTRSSRKDAASAEGSSQNGLLTPTSSPPSPTEAHPSLRIPRSASADPDKAHRLSRVWQTTTVTTSPLKAGDVTETDTEAETDQASVSGTERSPRSKARRRVPRGERKSKKVVIDDFEMIRVLGKGCAGKVLLVRHKAEAKVYALKAITKRHVLAHQELQHTLTEQAVLKRMAGVTTDPFVVKLHWSFHDKENLFLVLDFHPGGDLATQLARWGRLGRDRARFYAAELVEGVEGLHNAGVIYRDLKPENILIGGDGHIVLTDFGLSKEFPQRSSTAMGAGALPTAPSTPTAKSSSNGGDYYSNGGSSPTGSAVVVPSWMGGSGHALPKDQTTTFCGTAEYLAPEVIQGLPYSYEVDWWSFGTMLYEMLTGITPFWANNHSDMYVRVLQDELQFPEDRTMDQDTKSLIRGLLQRNPALRLSEPRIKRHPYFSMIDWSHVYYKRYIPPYIPPTDPSNVLDTQNFDDTFLDMEPTVDHGPDENDAPTDGEEKDQQVEDEPTDGDDSSVKTPPAAVKTPLVDAEEDGPDVFDGYSYKARHSILLDDDEDALDEHDVDEDEEHELDDLTNVTNTATPSIADMPYVETDDEAPLPEGAKTPQATATPPPEHVTAAQDVSTPTPQVNPTDKQLGARPAALAHDASTTTTTTTTTTKRPATGKSTEKAPPTAPVAKPVASAKQPRKARAERSGIAALDKRLNANEDEEEYVTEHEDDDWDFIEKPGGEEVNGPRGNSLFARGVVDRYRLAVFTRKSSPHPAQRPVPRSVSSISAAESDTPPASETSTRRGRTAGLGLKTRTFLRPKSPPSTFSSSTSRSFSQTGTSVSSMGLITPSPSLPAGQSLKSKPSTTSVAHSSSSDQSGNGDAISTSTELQTSPKAEPVADNSFDAQDKPKKKLKKAADQVFALFGSARP